MKKCGKGGSPSHGPPPLVAAVNRGSHSRLRLLLLRGGARGRVLPKIEVNPLAGAIERESIGDNSVNVITGPSAQGRNRVFCLTHPTESVQEGWHSSRRRARKSTPNHRQASGVTPRYRTYAQVVWYPLKPTSCPRRGTPQRETAKGLRCAVEPITRRISISLCLFLCHLSLSFSPIFLRKQHTPPRGH
jgi:hypothetical protein